MSECEANVRVIYRQIATARQKKWDIDPVFVTMRRLGKKYEVLVGRHERGGEEAATLLQGNLRADVPVDESGTCWADVFKSYITIAKAPDPVIVWPPLFTHRHRSFDGRLKLLVYVSVGVPPKTVYACAERQHRFCDTFWHTASDDGALRDLFEGERCRTKSNNHLAAVFMARSVFRLWHY